MTSLDDSPVFFGPRATYPLAPRTVQTPDHAQKNQPDPAPAPPRSYQVHDEAVWRAARDDYLSGHSAEAVCAQHNLNLSTFRHRARREGWRKSDAESPLPASLDDAPEPDAAPPTPELVDLAWRSAAAAIRRGRVHEARAWMRLWNELKAVAAEDEERERKAEASARWKEQQAAKAVADEALAQALVQADGAIKAEARLHPLHPDFEAPSDPGAPPAPPPGLVARQALLDAFSAEIDRGGRRPPIARSLAMVRDLLSEELAYDRQSPGVCDNHRRDSAAGPVDDGGV